MFPASNDERLRAFFHGIMSVTFITACAFLSTMDPRIFWGSTPGAPFPPVKPFGLATSILLLAGPLYQINTPALDSYAHEQALNAQSAHAQVRILRAEIAQDARHAQRASCHHPFLSASR